MSNPISEGFPGSRESSSRPDRRSSDYRSLAGIAEGGRIDLGCIGRLAGPERSARRTYGWHSLWPGDGHAHDRRRSFLVPN